MTTVHRDSGFTFRIWSNDHAPPHIHAWKAGNVVVINLDPVAVRANRGMSDADVVRAVRIVLANRDKMLAAWRDTHG
ncbi:MAG: DUF4160 domain-containing protein [Gemmatimonadetes bacterium]|nr:DUF4160 domain-containing protein [Gemmatimonadota bacterium]